MMNIVRWAILGAGKIAHSFVRDFPLLEHAELVAVASSNRQRAETFAAECKIPQAMDYEQLYNSSSIDAVYIATTHNFHYEQVLQCLLHGKSVLCEKPVTVNDSQWKKLASTAAEKKVFLMEAMWTYFLPAVQKAKEWVDQKLVGELQLIQSDFGFAMGKNPLGRMYNPELAGGALLDLGIYPVAIARFFTGVEPLKIHATGTLTETGVDETLSISLQYDNCTASLCTSLSAQLCNATRIYGNLGFIEIPAFWKASSASLYDKEGILLESYQDGRSSHGFIYEMQHATDMILSGSLQSPVMDHCVTNGIQETLTEIRRQIGLKYPFE